MQILIQIIGIAGMICSVACFQANTHKHIMGWQIATNLLFAVQYLMFGALSGFVINIISLLRSAIFYFKGQAKWADWKGWLPLIMITVIIAGFFTYDGWVSLLPVGAVLVNTVSFSFTNPKMVRATILTASPMWLTYHAMNHSLGGVIAETIGILSVLVGMLRFDTKKKKAV